MRGHDIAAKWIRIQWQIAGPYHLWAILFFSIIAIFSQYFLSIKLVKNVRNFLLSLPWECVCWYFLYNRNAVLYDFTTKIVYLCFLTTKLLLFLWYRDISKWCKILHSWYIAIKNALPWYSLVVYFQQNKKFFLPDIVKMGKKALETVNLHKLPNEIL